LTPKTEWGIVDTDGEGNQPQPTPLTTQNLNKQITMKTLKTEIREVEDFAANGVEATAQQLLLLSTIGQAEVPIGYVEGTNVMTGFNSEGTVHLVTHKWLVDAADQLEAPRVEVKILPKEQALLFANN
jgi:hypothetical protein